VIRKQPHDGGIVIRDKHLWSLVTRHKLNYRARISLIVRSCDFASRLLHDGAPVVDCRIRFRPSGISTSIKPQMN